MLFKKLSTQVPQKPKNNSTFTNSSQGEETVRTFFYVYTCKKYDKFFMDHSWYSSRHFIQTGTDQSSEFYGSIELIFDQD